jgi:hypothetical protein
VAGETLKLWPFASANLESPDDPINLLIAGDADPRDIRNALLALDGNRGAPFPPVFPFNCTWSDAIGGLMAGFGVEGWAGGAIQLQCGDYGPIRFHLRLFDLGTVTAANAHFEVVIPGTADHQVLSWELAEQLVAFDLARTGLLGAPPALTGVITPAPTHRAIPGIIYNGLPADLRALIGGPPVPSGDVGILNDGRSTVLVLSGRAPPAADPAPVRFTIAYDQIVPKPFCAAGPFDLVYVRGSVTLAQSVEGGEDYRMRFDAQGELEVVPIDPTTAGPAGEGLRATVVESQAARVGHRGSDIHGAIRQRLLPRGQTGAGELRIDVRIGAGGPARYDRDEACAPR